MPLLTVFTPTYNRAHTLGRLYKSLCMQSCKDFLWLVVDDGSSDGTAELVKRCQQADHGFEIRYLYKKNGGMHTAHNMAYAHIDTELNMCIDSDDQLVSDAIRLIKIKWEKVRNKGYAGLIGLDAYLDSGKVIGKGFPAAMEQTTLAEYYAHGGKGDKKLVYRTDIIKQYPQIPVFAGEKYMPPAYQYRLIDQDHALAVLDDVLCLVEYQPDGSTNTMWRQYLENPRGFACWRRLCMQYPQGRVRLAVDCIHYVSSCLLAGEKGFVGTSPSRLMTALLTPAGWLLSKCVKIKAKESV